EFLKKANLYAEQLVIHAYHGILGREPDKEGLESYTKDLIDHGDLKSIFHSLSNSPEHYSKINSNFHISETIEKINKVGNYVLIGIDHLVFLTFALSLADFLDTHLKVKTILFTYDHQQFIITHAKLSSSVIEILLSTELDSFLQLATKRPQMLIVHIFSKENDYRKIADSLPDVDLALYSDGLPNFVLKNTYMGRNPKGIFYSGFEQLVEEHGALLNPSLKTLGIIPWKSVFDYYSHISSNYIKSKQRDPIKATAILFLRYWQVGSYQIPYDIVIHALINLLSEHINKDDILVIKGDYRCSPEIFERLCDFIRSTGIQVYDYAEYLKQWGVTDIEITALLPFEMTIQPDMLASIKCYIVLDSSLSITLPYLLHYFKLNGKVKIICGISSSSFPIWVSNKFIAPIIPHTSYYRKILSEIIRPIHFTDLETKCYWSAEFNIENINTSDLDIPYYNEKLLMYKPNPIQMAVFFIPDESKLENATIIAQELWHKNDSSLFIALNTEPLKIKEHEWLFGVLDCEKLESAIRWGVLKIKNLYAPSLKEYYQINYFISLLKNPNVIYY
ncbi:MAG: hypothetical protein LBV67_02035, partial [Streptococcaceae bacterium]|nr:hypothetical protein [Streptococcaceae bacterium]